jgi:hypothetical protein
MSSSSSPTTPHPKHWDTPCVPIGVCTPPFESLHTQHSGTDHQSVGRLSSSLPLQSDPYTSTSPRALRPPCAISCAIPQESARLSHRLTPARSRTTTLAHTSPPRHFSAQLRFSASSPHALFTRNRCFHGCPFPPSSPVGEPAKLNPCVHETQSTCGRQLQSLPKLKG